MRALVMGGRDFTDLGKFQEVLERCKGELSEIVTHGYGNTDRMAILYSEVHNIPIKYFPIESEELISDSNRSILESEIDIAIIFWDGVSIGTKDMLQKVLEHNTANIDLILIRY